MATPSTTVDTQIEALLGREGGYSDHPADKGGPTMWGVTEQVARAFGYKGAMRDLSRAVAKTIYLNRYWHAPGLDALAGRFPDVAAELFDAGVNMGVAVAGTFLQRALNAFNQEGAHYADVPVDGGIGNLTLHAVDSFRQRRGVAGQTVLLEAVRCLRGGRYIDISEQRPANEAFTYGWFARLTGMDA